MPWVVRMLTPHWSGRARAPLSVIVRREGPSHRSYAGRSNEHRAPWMYVRKGAAQPALPAKKPAGPQVFRGPVLCIPQAGLSGPALRRAGPRIPERVSRFRTLRSSRMQLLSAAPQPGRWRNRKSRGPCANAQDSSVIRAEHGTFARYLARSNRIGMRCTILRALQARGSVHCGVLPAQRGGPYTVPDRRRLTNACSRPTSQSSICMRKFVAWLAAAGCVPWTDTARFNHSRSR